MKNTVSDILAIYSKIYDLAQIRIANAVNDLYLFLYDDNKEIAKFGFSGKLYGKNIHQSLIRMAGNDQIGEIMPVAILNKKSIVFMARVRNNKLPKNGVEIPTKIRKLIQQQLKAFDKNYLQNTEIETNHKYKLRYWFHKNLIKRFIITKRLKKTDVFNKILLDKLSGTRILDVSCGDSTLLNTKTDVEMIVFNDISLDMLLSKSIGQYSIITNHDATKLPFKDKCFDSILCRNTLHHMPSEKHLENLFNAMAKVSNHVLVVEIEDPQLTGGFPKFLNKFLYRKFLHDVGERYLSEQEFKKVISKKFDGVDYSHFRSPVGNYMIADIKIEDEL